MSVEEIEAAKSAFIIYDDFPIKGQSFRDIQPVLQCPQHVQTIRKVLFNQWKNQYWFFLSFLISDSLTIIQLSYSLVLLTQLLTLKTLLDILRSHKNIRFGYKLMQNQ
ncbi:Adenine_phosphoribosyltransferase [Hexamita inflata]|uniref:Adenine phosphoribosyltransferase n=1 Tax=Hexamita inflata TaxID=28002 RepID=A0AA86U6M3_9EUKA|nr:Adenine phosphoribosyltransferase [Hexamita inflata]